MSSTQTHLCSGPLPRREFLQAGMLALGGVSLADVLAARAATASGSSSQQVHSDTSVILLYLHGGPSHLETYDLKPEAPTEYRSIFKPIRTSVPGMELCELFPRQAALAEKFSLIRSLHHDVGIHSDGGIIVLTGKRPSRLDPTSQSKSEHPDFGSIASRVRGLQSGAAPPYVAIPRQPYMTRPTYLGMHHGAFVLGDVSAKNYSPPNLKLAAGLDGKRLSDRRHLTRQLDRLRAGADAAARTQKKLGLNVGAAEDEFQTQAYQMLTNSRTTGAFDLSQETDALRDRYGRDLWGQSCLMARRLAEAGTAVVSLFINTPKTGQEFTNWDDHVLNAGRPGHFGKYMRVRLPYMDQCLSALIEDIYDRSLDQQIMVVVVGEFGRTPRLRQNNNGAGRDHWPQAYTALVSGGGLNMGQVVGATNSKGEYPTERPYTPQDLLATVYRHLGIDPLRAFRDFFGRPIPILPSGEPIAELI